MGLFDEIGYALKGERRGRDKSSFSEKIGRGIGEFMKKAVDEGKAARGLSNKELLYREATSSDKWKRMAAKTELDRRMGKEGCYITTAVCGSFGKPDDCYELTMFRDFRDSWLRQQKDGKALISEYYATAPRIVAVIDRLSEAKEIYRDIWNNYLSPCLSHIENKEYTQCKDLYMKMVRNLKFRYL